MPRCIRNFWIAARIDGRRSKFASGPRTRDGGFNLDILYRERGHIGDRPIRVVGRRVGEKLALEVSDGDVVVVRKEVER